LVKQFRDLAKAASYAIDDDVLTPTESPNEFWYQTCLDAHAALVEALVTDRVEDVLVLIDQFGSLGQGFDFVLLFCDPYRMLSSGESLERILLVDPEIGSEAVGNMLRALVQRLLEDDDLIESYYRATLWSGGSSLDSGRGLNDLAVTVSANFPADSSEPWFWWSARDFVLLARATGRTEMVLGATPEELRRRFDQWFDWYQQEREHLRADNSRFIWRKHTLGRGSTDMLIPSLPFENWDGPSPSGEIVLWLRSALSPLAGQ
jgi:hypothetical protein